MPMLERRRRGARDRSITAYHRRYGTPSSAGRSRRHHARPRLPHDATAPGADPYCTRGVDLSDGRATLCPASVGVSFAAPFSFATPLLLRHAALLRRRARRRAALRRRALLLCSPSPRPSPRPLPPRRSPSPPLRNALPHPMAGPAIGARSKMKCTGRGARCAAAAGPSAALLRRALSPAPPRRSPSPRRRAAPLSPAALLRRARSPSPRPSPPQRSRSPRRSPSPQGWPCARCTFTNEMHRKRCQMCRGGRPKA